MATGDVGGWLPAETRLTGGDDAPREATELQQVLTLTACSGPWGRQHPTFLPGLVWGHARETAVSASGRL